MDEFKLLQLMLPGNGQVPGFCDLDNHEQIAMKISLYQEALELYEEITAEGLSLDINEALKIMRKRKVIDMDGFLQSVLELYFAHPQVIRSITGTPVPLYPSNRVLPDIDYELLEPVYLRDS